MKKVKHIIIGGGISGLSAALFLNSSDTLIIEKEDTVGGYCKTTIRGEYVWDYAGHFYHFKTDEFRNWFTTEIPASQRVFNEKNTKIVLKNNFIDYPFQTNIHQLDKEDLISCICGLFGSKNNCVDNENFLSMLYRNYGEGIVNLFLRPYNEKLYACDLNSLDCDAMGRFFPAANKTQIIDSMQGEKSKSYNDSFWYPKRGAQVFIDILLEKCRALDLKINTNEIVLKINLKEHKVYTTKDVYEYEFVVNTLPLNLFYPIVEGMPSQYNIDFSYNKVLVFNMGFEKGISSDSPYKDVHWIYVPEKKYNFYRVGFYNHILHMNKLSLYIEIGFNKCDEIDVRSELNKTIIGLKELGILDEKNKLVEYDTIVMSPAYIHISTQSQTMIKNYLEELKSYNAFSIGRYGSWRYCSMEDCMLQGEKIANYIKNKTS